MDKKNSQNICVITRPKNRRDYNRPIEKFSSVLDSIADKQYLLSSSGIDSEKLSEKTNPIYIDEYWHTDINWIDFWLVQIYILIELWSIRRSIDMVYIHKGASSLVVPIIMLRTLQIKTVVIRLSDYAINKGSQNLIAPMIKTATEWTGLCVANGVVTLSNSTTGTVPNKNTYTSMSNYINYSKFDYNKHIHNRKYDIGFVGRLNDVKRPKLFFDSAEGITTNDPKINVVIAGDGPLYDTLQIRANRMSQINMKGWISYDELPNLYNDIKLLVITSRSEGLPTVLLEAMSCGVVVLANNVGDISDVINNGKNGFILDSDSPMEINREISSCLNHSELNKISKNARDTIKRKYSKQAAIERFDEITADVLG
jgi:glycosyltransferase involved in cell wall biosynthesis